MSRIDPPRDLPGVVALEALSHVAPIERASVIARALEGDLRAQDELYAQHAPRVRVVLMRILHVPDDVDDVMQETFARAFRKLHTLREHDALSGWLVAVAVGAARHHLRARSRRRWLTFFAPEELPEVEAPTVSPEVREAARATERLLRDFPLEERIALSLRFVDGLTLEEAAAACGTSLATFKRRLRSAAERLRARAADEPALARYLRGAR